MSRKVHHQTPLKRYQSLSPARKADLHWDGALTRNYSIDMSEREIIVELKNTFHGTRVCVRVPEAHAENAWSYLQWMAIDGDDSAKRKVARITRELCPRAGCQCGTVRN